MASKAILRAVESINTPTKKKTQRKSTRSSTKKIVELGIVDQVNSAFAPDKKVAGIIGTLFGGIVPTGVYIILHTITYSVATIKDIAILSSALTISLGGLVVSAITVWKWAVSAFNGDHVKATGFVVFLEGAMALCGNESFGTGGYPLTILSFCILGLLILVNGASSAYVLANTKKL